MFMYNVQTWIQATYIQWDALSWLMVIATLESVYSNEMSFYVNVQNLFAITHLQISDAILWMRWSEANPE